MKNQQNPYLNIFLENSRKVRNKITSDSKLIEKIKEKLLIEECHRGAYIPDSWDKKVYMPLKEGVYGIKKRELLFNTQIETTVIADIFRPDLLISPFAVVFGETPKYKPTYYIIKDFGEVKEIRYIHSNNQFNEIISYLKQKGYSSDDWENIFSFNLDGDLVMTDLNCGNMDDENFEEIRRGAKYGEGKFSRLSEIWKILNSPEYKIN